MLGLQRKNFKECPREITDIEYFSIVQTNWYIVVKNILNDVNPENIRDEQIMTKYNYSLLKETTQNSFIENCMNVLIFISIIPN